MPCDRVYHPPFTDEDTECEEATQTQRGSARVFEPRVISECLPDIHVDEEALYNVVQK